MIFGHFGLILGLLVSGRGFILSGGGKIEIWGISGANGGIGGEAAGRGCNGEVFSGQPDR